MKTYYYIQTNKRDPRLNEIYFEFKPEKKIIDSLKKIKIVYNKKKVCWEGYVTREKIIEAIGPSADFMETFNEFAFKNTGDGIYWQGGNYNNWKTIKKLSRLLLSDLTKAGIEASINENKEGGLSQFSVVMGIKKNEILSYEEWVKTTLKGSIDNYHIMFDYFYDYVGMNGFKKTIYGKNYYKYKGPNKDRIKKSIVKIIYEKSVCNILNHNVIGKVELSMLSDSARRRFWLLQEIVASYNRDLLYRKKDKFDHSFYENYAFKVIR